jgi:microcystin-dependent protein
MLGIPFVGNISIFAGNFAPVGWRFCDGSLLAIAEYEVLFTIIGTTYGGDGQSTFALPDLRGRIAIHPGSGFVIGQMSGTENTTMTTATMPAHSHVVDTVAGTMGGTTAAGTTNSPNNAVPAKPTRDLYNTSADGEKMAPNNAIGALPIAGGSFPIPILSPYLAMNYVIATEGTFPSQS